MNVASTKWEHTQHHTAMAGGRLVTRLSQAADGMLLSEFYTIVENMLVCEDAWLGLLLPHQRTQRATAQAFLMLARTSGGVSQNLGHRNSAYPFRLFRSGRPAEAGVTPPACMQGDFACGFDAAFPSQPQGLDWLGHASGDRHAVLMALSLLGRLDISRIECRHVSLRRLLHKTGTSSKEFVSASSDFYLLRQRIHERGGARQGRPVLKKVGKQSKACRRVGGGPQTAYKGTFLAGRRFENPGDRARLVKEGNALYRACSAEELAGLRRLGALPSRARKAGGRSFGAVAASSALRRPPAVADNCIEIALVARGVADFSAALALIRRQHRDDAWRRQEEEQGCSLVLKEWSAAAVSTTDPGVSSAVSPCIGAQLLPVGPRDILFTFLNWVPPGADIALRALSVLPSRSTDLAALLEAARSKWADMHQPIFGNALPDLGKPTYEKHTVCWQAGFCVCSDGRGVLIRSFVVCWVHKLREWMAKSAAARVLHDGGTLVLRMVSGHRGVQSPTTLWCHVSDGNLNRMHFSFFRLEQVDTSLRARAADADSAFCL